MGGWQSMEQLPRDIGDLPLWTFQTHLDAFLCHQLQVTLPWQGWMISRDPS